MTYTIIDHGTWVPYTQDVVLSPEGHPMVPAGTIFCKRESDGVDWYEFSRTEGAFAEGTVLVACLKTDLGFITQAVYSDPQLMFPQNCTLIEVLRWEGDKPHTVFGARIYDPEAHTFSDLPKAPLIVSKKVIWERATDEEAETIQTVLSQQSVRKQMIFREALYISHDEPLFADLLAGFVTAFGKERADELLAGS